MAEHTSAQKRFIVLRLAAFDTPRVICDAFRAWFPGVLCREEDVIALDPCVGLVPPDLKALFYEERRRVLDPDTPLAEVAPYAEQRARFIALSKLVARYEGNNQPAEARAVMRQIAEEQGAIGKGGVAPKAPESTNEKPIETITRTVIDPGHTDAASIPAAPAAETV